MTKPRAIIWALLFPAFFALGVVVWLRSPHGWRHAMNKTVGWWWSSFSQPQRMIDT